MRHWALLAIVGVLCAPAGIGSADARRPTYASPSVLLDEFDTECLGPAGDHVWTWSLARSRGYVDLPASERESFIPWGFARDIRAMTRTVDGVEYRLMTAKGGSKPVGSSGLTDGAQVNLCWVSARPTRRGEVVSHVGRLLHVRSFRAGDSRIFPWLEDAQGRRESVRRGHFENAYHQLIREEHMQIVSVASYGDGWTILGYVRHRDPDPVPDAQGRY